MKPLRLAAKNWEAVEEARGFAEMYDCLTYINPAPPMTDYTCIVVFYRFLGRKPEDIAMHIKLQAHPQLEILMD